MKVPEQYRLRKHPILASDSSYGCNGYFVIPHNKIGSYSYGCMVSDGEGWEHVSVTLSSTERKVERCPTWEEMCYIKSLFWDDEDTVMQLHPPKSQWVTNHPYCLHLWRPYETAIPLPNQMMVGLPSMNRQQNSTI